MFLISNFAYFKGFLFIFQLLKRFLGVPNAFEAFPTISSQKFIYRFPISWLCTFLPVHWRLILLIHDISLVIGGKLHSEYLGFSLLVANYSRNIPFFLHWQPGCRHIPHGTCSLIIPNNSLYNASNYICRKITSHWQPLFSKKMVAAASFSYKIGGGGIIFLQNWRRWPHFPTKLEAVASFSYKIGGGGKDLATLLAAVLTWPGYWTDFSELFPIFEIFL